MLVSVIVPSYNRAPLISRCYESVCRQGHRPIEFILVDDYSTDATELVAQQLQKVEGVQLTYLKLPFNQGVSAARNAAARVARGEFIAFLDSDDVWFDNHLSKLLRLIDSPNVDVAYSRGDIRESPDAPPSGRSNFGPTQYEQAHLRECIFYYNFVLPSATIVKRDFFKIVGLFDEDPKIQHAEDWDIFIRAAQLGLNFMHLTEATTYYTIPAESSDAKRQMMIRRGLYCLEKHKMYPFVSLPNKHQTFAYYQIWLSLLVGLNSSEAVTLFRKTLRSSYSYPLIAFTSLLGLAIPRTRSVIKKCSERLLYKAFRSVRARQRKLRGFTTLFD